MNDEMMLLWALQVSDRAEELAKEFRQLNKERAFLLNRISDAAMDLVDELSDEDDDVIRSETP